MSLHHIAPRDDYDPAWDNETYVHACPDCGTQGALHLNGCPVDPWAAFDRADQADDLDRKYRLENY